MPSAATAPAREASPSRRPKSDRRAQIAAVETPAQPAARRRVVRAAVWGGIALAVVLIGVLVLQVVMVTQQQQLDRLLAERTRQSEQYQALRRTAASVQDPAAMADKAASDLGMVPVPDVVYLTPETVPMHKPFTRTLPKPAAPVTAPTAATPGATATASASASGAQSTQNGSTGTSGAGSSNGTSGGSTPSPGASDVTSNGG